MMVLARRFEDPTGLYAHLSDADFDILVATVVVPGQEWGPDDHQAVLVEARIGHCQRTNPGGHPLDLAGHRCTRCGTRAKDI